MRGNPLGIMDPCEIKLLKLYKQHELISLKIINLLNLEFISINENNALLKDDGSNLEEYSLIEKGLIAELSGLNKVIKSYESAGSVSSSELDLLRAEADIRHSEIRDLSKVNRKLLRISLGKMASMLELFIKKSIYYSSSAGQISPQFIDVKI